MSSPADTVRAATWAAGLDELARGSFDLLVADLRDPALVDALRTLHQAAHILAHAADGIALVDFDLRIRWANPRFRQFCDGNPIGRGFYEALGSPGLEGPDFCPFHSALASAGSEEGAPAPAVSARLACHDNRHLDLRVTLLPGRDVAGPLFIALAHDATVLVQHQQKLDRLYRAGRELVALDAQQLADLEVPQRIDLLRNGIRRLTHDLLQYEMIDVRVLDEETGILRPLLQEGMTPDAVGRELRALPEGNGVTGFVAATGKSYLCPDVQADPLYLPGGPGARSSLTVPLRFADRIVGTFNVESPRPGAFGEADLQFAEVFGHAVAAALHTLELLRFEKTVAATESVDTVHREVALPVDDILADATWLLERYVGHDPDVAERIRQILCNARQIKQSILKVGESLAPRPLPSAIREAPPPELKGLRVLVADNDDSVRRSAHALIGRWGGVVETARDGKEALTMARLASYDAIVADIRLPDLSGYEVFRALREAQPSARVILMTGYGYDPGHSLTRARQEGLRHVLFKPFRVDQLRTALANLGKDS
jgi:CheY-like chemotaxis protein/GAF domain-containing protein